MNMFMVRNRNYSRKIYISTNSTCNLDCIYCFEKEKKQFEFNVEDAVGIIKEQLRTPTPFGTQISLRGGEPFIVFPKIKQLCETLWNDKFEEYYHFHITTNGTLIHGEILDWLSVNRDKITIKISLDGDKNSSDINRPNSFERIDFQFLVSTWPDIKANMTITSQTLPYLSRNVQFINSLGIKQIVTHFSIMTNWGNCRLENVLYEQLLDLSNYYLQHPQVELCNFFNKDISRTLIDKPSFTPCNHGQQAYDSQTKRYYPCYMCFPSVGGEKVSEKLRKIDFREAVLSQEGLCVSCPFINLCTTCFAENYISRGSIAKRDMSLCKYQQITFAVLFLYEYKRIMRLEYPSSQDVRKMKAIQKWHNEVEDIINNIPQA